MHYYHIKPGASARRYIEFYWALEDRSYASGNQRIVPDGRSGFILNLGSPFESYANGKWTLQPHSFFVGQITSPLLLRPSGPVKMLGIQFRPHGAMQFLRLPMSELTDSAIALEDLAPRLFMELERVRHQTSLRRALAALDPVFFAFAGKTPIDNDLVSCAVKDIERAGGLVNLTDVAARIGWSARQLQRRFRDAVGISPKLFGRMQRFQGVFRAMENPILDWVNVAIDCGYYDQAHLIRDFREFTGKTPSLLLDQEIDLTRRFVQTRTMSHFSKTAGEATC